MFSIYMSQNRKKFLKEDQAAVLHFLCISVDLLIPFSYALYFIHFVLLLTLYTGQLLDSQIHYCI